MRPALRHEAQRNPRGDPPPSTHSSIEPRSGRGAAPDSRYLVAIRRSRWMIIGPLVVIITVTVAPSPVLPKTYEGKHAPFVLNVQQGIGDTDPTTLERELTTLY